MIKRFFTLIVILIALTIGLYCLEAFCYFLGSLTPGDNLFWLEKGDKGYREATVGQGFVYFSMGLIVTLIVVPILIWIIKGEKM